jgi:hypothetical protein
LQGATYRRPLPGKPYGRSDAAARRCMHGQRTFWLIDRFETYISFLTIFRNKDIFYDTQRKNFKRVS